ncbi:MAG: exodeoxyribonuclease V subunit gamma [Myxococcales bacterium FL481]|nr:MAG: exodeoxyribonuclease V subunit gamma [Myxococcales bacterium FL481]
MYVHRSNRGEPLVGALADIVRTPVAAPLVPECIVVQSRGIERWLGNELAKRLGAWCNPDFCYPRTLLERLSTAPNPSVADARRFEPETLMWSIAELLQAPLLDDPRCVPLRRYLADDPGNRRRLALAARIAAVFDGYQDYRRDKLLASWERGRGDHWQSVLWRAIVAREGSPGPFGALLSAWRSAAPPPPPRGFPRRISVFGLSTVAPAFLQVLSGLSRHVDVHLFVLAPTREYWGDVQRSDAVSFALTSPAVDTATDAPRGHRLLGALGEIGRQFHAALEQVGYRDGPYDLFVDPGEHCALARLQSDMLKLREPRSPRERTAVSPEDDSIGVHVCHSALREVQVVHDQLRARFERDHSLEPRDVVVLAPDIETYAPYVDAVFGHQSTAPIPYQVADRPFADQSGLVKAYFRLLGTLSGRLSAPEVADLLGHAPIARRFDLRDNDVPRLRTLIRDANVRWGLDGQHRAQFDLPADRANTWEFGLDRLFYGLAVTHEASPLDDVVALPHVEGDSTRLVGQLAQLVHTLSQFNQRAAQPRRAAEWAHLLRELLDATLAVDVDHPRERDHLVAAIDELESRSALAESQTEFGFAGVVEQLERLVRDAVPTQPFLAGGVTFCRLTPMRSVPFRVVVVMGLADDAFPRTGRTASFDLIAKHPEPGDRNPRHDDRYVFLEAILAARDALLLTYQGRSPHDTRQRPPSTVVAELLDVLDQTLVPAGRGRSRRSVLEQLVTHHALHPFAPAYLQGDDPRRFTYSPRYGPIPATRSVAPPFVVQPVRPARASPRDGIALALDALVDFYRHPARWFLRDTLRLHLAARTSQLSAFEPVELDGLERWSLGTASLAAVASSVDRTTQRAQLRGAGQLPTGSFGELEFLEARLAAERLAAAGPAAVGEARAKRFRLELEQATLVGTLPITRDNRLVRRQFTRDTGPSELGWWITHLAACALGWIDAPSVLVGRPAKGHGVATTTFAIVSDAQRILAELLRWLQVGSTVPLPFVPPWSRRLAERPDATADLARLVPDDPYTQLAFRGRDPWTNPRPRHMHPGASDAEAVSVALDDRYGAWVLAALVYNPLFAAKTT